MLQATSIVPRIPSALEKEPLLRSTSPIATTGKRKISAIKSEELEEEANDEDDLAREKELLAELERIRSRQRSKKESDVHSMKKIKTEPKTFFTPGEIIDLT